MTGTVARACGAIPSPPLPGCGRYAAGAAWGSSAPRPAPYALRAWGDPQVLKRRTGWIVPTLCAGVPHGDGGTSHALKAMGEGGHNPATGPYRTAGPGAQSEAPQAPAQTGPGLRPDPERGVHR
jgi:hypothetical protein